ncbi:hypothetical protein ACHHYP_02030 [Achlya hypogyna]|uniref:CRAL-TRIO domain-containing protein n=1 Tax=Achlya hypogyna TaxID=1202772 RepID=A0A1V9ZT61_ACHHY|nr:hypothetical protein ACHHYP_02030 [Achlya hypogyna]
MSTADETLNVLKAFKLRVLAEFSLPRLRAAGLAPDQYLDDTLLRYLAARQYEVNDALAMVRKSMRWREECDIGRYSRQLMVPLAHFDAVRHFHPQGCHGVDKEGNVLVVERWGDVNTEALGQVCTTKELVKVYIQLCEHQLHHVFPRTSASVRRAVTKATLIYDLEGVKLQQFIKFMYQISRECAEIYRDHYPEVVHRVFIINAPLVFCGTWKLVEVFLDEPTRSKVTILGKTYRPTLLKHVAASQLPKTLGGTCECFPGRPHGSLLDSSSAAHTTMLVTPETLAAFKARVLSEFSLERMEASGLVPAGNLDDTMSRYLLARPTESESFKMLSHSLKWREENNIGRFSKQFMVAPEKLQVIRQYLPQGCHGVDKNGNVLFFEHLGFLDSDAMAKTCTIHDVLNAHIQKCEYQMHYVYPLAAAKMGKTMTKSTVIYDLSGIGMHTFKKVVYQFIKEVAVINQDHYPETLNKVFIVNTPLFFYGTWKLIEVFLNETSRKKVSILGKNYKSTLLQHVDPDQLPKTLGGTCECFPGQPLGGCISTSKFTATHFWNEMDQTLSSYSPENAPPAPQ